MSDDNQSGDLLTQPTAPGGEPALSPPTPPPAGPEHKGVAPWVWIVASIVVVALLLGIYYTTQTEQGHLWLLGLRSMAVVPNVVGQSQSTGQATLSSAGFRVGQVSQEQTLAAPPGVITSQTPPAGTEAKKDSAIGIFVAVIPTVNVENVVGQAQSDAITVLAEQGLRTGAISYVYDSKVKTGDVTAQQPSAGAETTVGSAVNLTVSKGTQQGQVPNVVGLSQDDANSVITADGFKVTTVKASNTNVPAGDVISQSPAAGVGAPTGSTVTITVSTGAPAPASSQAPTSSTTPTAPASPSTPPPTKPGTPTKPSTPGKPSTLPAPTVEVPDVVGLRVLDAVTTLRKVQLKVSFAFGPSDTNVLKVASQDPVAGASATPGDTVTITIGLPSFSLPGGTPTQPLPVPVQQPTATPQPAPTPAPAPAPKPTPNPAPSAPST